MFIIAVVASVFEFLEVYIQAILQENMLYVQPTKDVFLESVSL